MEAVFTFKNILPIGALALLALILMVCYLQLKLSSGVLYLLEKIYNNQLQVSGTQNLMLDRIEDSTNASIEIAEALRFVAEDIEKIRKHHLPKDPYL